LDSIVARLLDAEARGDELAAARGRLVAAATSHRAPAGSDGGGDGGECAAAALPRLELAPAEWERVTAAALARRSGSGDDEDCAICMMAIRPRVDAAGTATVTSCGHMFHTACMRSLEAFVGGVAAPAAASAAVATRSAGGEAGNPPLHPPNAAKCPLCRARYTRRLVAP